FRRIRRQPARRAGRVHGEGDGRQKREYDKGHRRRRSPHRDFTRGSGRASQGSESARADGPAGSGGAPFDHRTAHRTQGLQEDQFGSAQQDDAGRECVLHLPPCRRRGWRTAAASIMFTLTLDDFIAARSRIAPHIKHTPLLTSRQLSERTGFDVRLKAEVFQRVGSYKIRGPLNKFSLMPQAEKKRGVVCSSAGNHAQGVALAAKIHGIRAVVRMAENATPAKIAATKGYGAEVVLHGTIWDEANEKARELVRDQGLTYVHPFDDEQLIAGQGTRG